MLIIQFCSLNQASLQHLFSFPTFQTSGHSHSYSFPVSSFQLPSAQPRTEDKNQSYSLLLGVLVLYGLYTVKTAYSSSNPSVSIFSTPSDPESGSTIALHMYIIILVSDQSTLPSNPRFIIFKLTFWMLRGLQTCIQMLSNHPI